MQSLRLGISLFLGFMAFVPVESAKAINIKVVNNSKNEANLKDIDSIWAVVTYSRTKDPHHSTRVDLSKKDFPMLGKSAFLAFEFVKRTDESLKIKRIDFMVQFERKYKYCQMRKKIKPGKPYQETYEFNLSHFSPEMCLREKENNSKDLFQNHNNLTPSLPR